jgi:hypothetical protein
MEKISSIINIALKEKSNGKNEIKLKLTSYGRIITLFQKHKKN